MWTYEQRFKAFTLRDGAPLTKGEFQTLLEDLTTALERVVIALFLYGVNVFAKGAPGQVDEFPRHWNSTWEKDTMRTYGAAKGTDFKYAQRQLVWHEEPLGDGAEMTGLREADAQLHPRRRARADAPRL